MWNPGNIAGSNYCRGYNSCYAWTYGEWKDDRDAIDYSDGTVGKAYGAKRTPEMVIINTKGDIVYHGAIDDNPGFDEAEIKDAKNFIAVNLEALLAGEKLPIANNKAYGCGIKYKR